MDSAPALQTGTHSPHLMQSGELMSRWGSIPIGQAWTQSPHCPQRSARRRRPNKLTLLNTDSTAPIGHR